MSTITMDEHELANRVVAVYNEPDVQKRNKEIPTIWTTTGEHLGGFQAKGYPALEEGIKGTHENYVVAKGMKFRAYNARQRENVISSMFDAVSAESGEVLAFGSAVFFLAEDGRIEKDFTFVLQDRYSPDDGTKR